MLTAVAGQHPAAAIVYEGFCLDAKWLLSFVVQHCTVLSYDVYCHTMYAGLVEACRVWRAAGSDMEQAVQMAQGAAFQQAVARAHYLAGNFLQALHSAIHATSTPGLHPCLPGLWHSRSRLTPAELLWQGLVCCMLEMLAA